MAFGFGMSGVTPPSPSDDNALDPQLAALLRAHLERTGGGVGALPGSPPAAPAQGVGTTNPRAPFGLYAPAQPGADDDGPAATPPGYSGFTPSPTPTGGATPVASTSGLPSIGSVLHGMTSGATQTGDTLTDLGSYIGSALGDMAGRSKDLIGRMQSGEISPGQFLSGAVSHARDAAMAGPNFTRDFLAGKIDPGSEEAAGGAFQAAATAMTGSLPFGVPAGALRTFGGRAAVTADHAALDRAAAMQAAGASPKSIWQGTGWGLGRDGVARFEIPDDAARLLPQTGASATTLGSVLDHPALFDAYPAMRDVSVFNRPELGANAADVFDLPHLMENDPAFVARARQTVIDENGGAARAGRMFDERHARMLDEFQSARDLNRQLTEMGYPATEVPQVQWGWPAASARSARPWGH